jgi:ankyrin repeat protein
LTNNRYFVNRCDENRNAALQYSVENSNADLANLLIGMGANVYVQNDYGDSPLYVAVRNRNVDMTEFFMNSNVDADLRDDEGWTALYYYFR